MSVPLARRSREDAAQDLHGERESIALCSPAVSSEQFPPQPSADFLTIPFKAALPDRVRVEPKPSNPHSQKLGHPGRLEVTSAK